MRIKKYSDGNIKSFKPQSKSFVIWANHPIFHAECTPWYAKLLLELKYNVDIVMIENKSQVDSLCRMKNEKWLQVHIFQNTKQLITSLLKESKNIIWLMVTTWWLFYPNEEIARLEKTEITSHIKNLLKILHLPKYSHLIELAKSFEKNVFIFHKTWQLANKKRPIIGDRIVHNAALLFKSKIMPEFPMINPHYFGAVKQQAKHKITRFTVIGEIRKDKRNYEDLIESAVNLHNKWYRFKINIIWKWNIEDIPKSVQSKFNIMGYLSFKEMYNVIEKTDFILPLFDSTLTDQRVYATEKTSGAIQLIYGFKKIPIIEHYFSAQHQFNNKNAILHDTKKLFTGMLKAIKMPNNMYKKAQDELAKLSTKIHKESINNLTKLLHKCE